VFASDQVNMPRRFPPPWSAEAADAAEI